MFIYGTETGVALISGIIDRKNYIHTGIGNDDAVCFRNSVGTPRISCAPKAPYVWAQSFTRHNFAIIVVIIKGRRSYRKVNIRK